MLERGMFSWFGVELQLKRRLELIKQAGFSATCIWLGSEEELVSTGRAGDIPGMVRDAGLFLDNIHAPFRDMYRIWSDSRWDRESVFSDLSAALEFCVKYQIPRMVVHPEVGPIVATPGQCGLDLFHRLTRQAEENNVVIAVENIERPDCFDYLLGNIDSPNLGFCYDSSHDFLPGGTHGEILRRWGHRLAATHLSDNHGEADDHLLPFDGNVDWQHLSRLFPCETYTGTLMLETDGARASGGYTPEQFLYEGFSRLDRLAEMFR